MSSAGLVEAVGRIERARREAPAAATAYGTIYFPAQRIHLARDDHKGAASLVLPNDPRLDPGRADGSRG